MELLLAAAWRIPTYWCVAAQRSGGMDTTLVPWLYAAYGRAVTTEPAALLHVVQVMAAGKQAICQTSKWLGSLTVEQGRKLAAAHAKEAARAARAAASVSAEGGEEEEGEEQQGEDACLDEDQEDAAEAAGEPCCCLVG